MEICECNNPKTPHHPSIHYAEKRDALIARIEEFALEKYPKFIFGDSFNRKQVALIAACFILDEIEHFAPSRSQ